MFVVRSLYRDTALAAAAAARANIIHHHKLNLQIEFSAAQHYAVALQCCMLRAAVPSDDEVTVIYRAKVAIKAVEELQIMGKSPLRIHSLDI